MMFVVSLGSLIWIAWQSTLFSFLTGWFDFVDGEKALHGGGSVNDEGAVADGQAVDIAGAFDGARFVSSAPPPFFYSTFSNFFL